MPAVQTSYPPPRPPAYPGMVANGEWVTNVISRIVDPATANPINFGDPVLQGASEQTVQSGQRRHRRVPRHRGARPDAAAGRRRPVSRRPARSPC